ncbi:Fis family transcriptional regulator [Pseudomonas syringae pv. aptata]|nr:Fis family transcriptional regulator [Pseudomonas syringae pv. aptata]
MLLLHTSSFGTLRREIIERLGQEQARGMFTRAGYLSGARDARLIRERWPQADASSAFRAGTHLHTLEGMTKVEPLHFKFDAESGFYEGEFLWHHSCEADEHVAAYGIGQDPVCWTEIGYATGFVSGLFGQMVVFREVECRGMGHGACELPCGRQNLGTMGRCRTRPELPESGQLTCTSAQRPDASSEL